MILQRLATKLNKKNWSAALLEILIVVIGIFIGLQVDDWNDSRKDRKDEETFLQNLHDDVAVAEELSSRLRQRRIDRLELILSAGDVLHRRNQRTAFTEAECSAIVWSTAFNMTAATLPSVDELIGSGRMGIIRSTELRTALVALRQTRAALDATIMEKTASPNFVPLPSSFPDLFRLTEYFDANLGEVTTLNECDLDGMRANQHFLSQFSTNADGYDAYVRDGVKPWSLQFDRVHRLVDSLLSIEHEAGGKD